MKRVNLQLSISSKYVLLTLVFLFVFTGIFFYFSINKPLNTDEALYVLAAHEVNKDYRAFSKNPEPGLWHPPLYVYTLSVVFKIFGEAAASARMLGILFYLTTLWFLILICRELSPPGRPFFITSFIAAALYLTNPLLIQYSMNVDIDGGMLTSSICAFSYLFIRSNRNFQKLRNFFLLGLLFGGILLIKFTTPLLIPIAIFLFYIFRKFYKKAFLGTFFIVLAGLIFAWSVWYIYCKSLNIQLFFPFQYTLPKMHIGSFKLTDFKTMAIKSALLYTIFWVSPAFIFLLVVSIFNRLRLFLRQKRISRIDFLAITGCLIWFLDTVYISTYVGSMKYQVPMYPLFIIVIANFIYESLFKDTAINSRALLMSIALGAVSYCCYLFLFPDMLLLVTRRPLVLSDLLKNQYYPRALFMLLYLVPFLIFPFIFVHFKKTFSKGLIFAALLLTFTMQLSHNTKQTANYTTANSWYMIYGETGEADAITYLNKKLPLNGAAMARRDIVYYLTKGSQYEHRKCVVGELIFTEKVEEAKLKFNRLMEQYNFKYVQVDNCLYYGSDFLERVGKIIGPNFVFDKKFGDFVIYEKRP